MEVTLREYKKEDFKVLQNIIRKTWHYDDLCGPETAQRLARVFLSSCLTNYTFSRVALENGVPVGIILVNHKAKHKCSFRLMIQQVKAITSLFLSKECKTQYPAELSLFAVDESCRGKGIGKLLFQSALDYVKEEKLDKFYLFTDTSCNFGFYEHQGMIRKKEKEHRFDINGQAAKMNFFIYDYTL